MAKLSIDLSGRGGVTALTDDVRLQYIGKAGDMADGTWNPFRVYGYLAPANNSFKALTGTITDRIVTGAFDPVNNIAYLGEGNDFLKLDGLADTSLSAFLTIDSNRTILDTELYELAGHRTVAYVTDSSVTGDGMAVGFFGLDSKSGLRVQDTQIEGSDSEAVYETIGNSDTNQKLAQRLNGVDVVASSGESTIDRIRLRLARLGAGTSYTIRVGLQRGTSSAPDGSFVVSATINPSTIGQTTGTDTNGEDVYVDITETTLDGNIYWLVVEPTVIGDMTGTNSFVWYRTNNDTSLYANGNTYQYNGSSWSTADSLTAESYDYSLMFSHTETWFPVNDIGLYEFTTSDTVAITDTSTDYNASILWDSTHVINAYIGADNDGQIQVFTVDPTLGTLDAVGSPLEFDLSANSFVRLAQFDATHLIVVYATSAIHAKAQVCAVDANYAITAVGTPLEFDATPSAVPLDVMKLDSTHVVVIWRDSAGKGIVRTLAIDGAFAVTTATGSQLELESGTITAARLLLLDSTHLLASWVAGNVLKSRVLVVSAYDWTAAAASTTLSSAVNSGLGNTLSQAAIDSSHAILAYGTTGDELHAQTITINLSTWAITANGDATIDQLGGAYPSIKSLRDDIYVIAYNGVGTKGDMVAVQVTGAYALIKRAVPTSFADSAYVIQLVGIDDSNVVVFYRPSNSSASANAGKLLNVSLVFNADNFYIQEGQTSFIRKADNGLLYWFVGKDVHIIDGSVTGGNTGSISKGVLQFPSYLTPVDAVDTNGLMCIALHSNLTASGGSDTRYFSSDTAGVFIWDRLSTVVRSRDFIPLYGVREIKRIFLSRNGVVMLLCISSKDETELRALKGNQFIVIQKLPLNGYPPYRHSLTYIDEMAAWQSNDGTLYAYGQTNPDAPESLYKIGTLAGQATNFTPGIMLLGNSADHLAAYLSFADGATQKMSRWHLDGTGTQDSVASLGHIGTVTTLVVPIGAATLVENMQIFAIPLTDDGAGNTTVIASVKMYYNRSNTVAQTFTLTRNDLLDGYVYLPLNRKNCTALQMVIEWSTTQTLGQYDFMPSSAVVNFNEKIERKK